MKLYEIISESKKVEAPKPRNFVAKNAVSTTSGAGAHKDKKKAEKQGDFKHKKEKVPMDEAGFFGGGGSFSRGWKVGGGRHRDPEDWDEGNTEPPNNFAVYINGKKWKVFKGRGQFADDYKEIQHFRQLRNWAQAKSASTGKKWEVFVTGEPATESMQETATAGATSAGNVGVGAIYKNKPGKTPKNKDGTAKNALDMKNNLLTGGSVKR